MSEAAATLLMAPIQVASPGFGLLLAGLAAAGWAGLRGRSFAALAAAAGLALAASWLTPRAALLFLAALAPAYVATRWLWGRPERAGAPAVAALIVWQIALLAATKLGGWSQQLGLAGVVGLSYLAFRQIHLLLFAARRPKGEAFDAALWLSYLVNPWTLLAGPVATYDAHAKALAAMARPDGEAALAAAHRVATGLVKVLVLAPIFAGQGDVAGLARPDAGWRDGLVVFYAYYVFLFLDFSGYCDLVIGAARLAGFRGVPENFDRPYLAANLQDFWNRWNITLGLWFRAHVFTPLLATLMRRWGVGKQDAAVALSLVAVFVLIGLWHGLAWNYALFGLIHALGVAGAYLLRQAILRRRGAAALKAWEANRWARPLRILACQHAVAASFILLDNDVAAILALFGRPT